MILACNRESSPEANGNLGLLILSSSTSTSWFNPVIKTLQRRQANRVGPNSEKKAVAFWVNTGMRPTMAFWWFGNMGLRVSWLGTRVQADDEILGSQSFAKMS